ncbi:MAG: flagellar assembly protein FliX [Devosiaceae bacterium]|nr:flagellar assembly protein FliX [Devosiaceae bacterium]
MRIEKSGQSSRVSSKAKSGKSSGASPIFKPNMGQDNVQVAQVSVSDNITPVDAILALQAVEDPLFAKKKAARYGHSMLDVLQEMKVDMLAGKVTEGHLNRLLALVQQAKSSSEKGLDDLIEDIELRARVELAKLGHFPN